MLEYASKGLIGLLTPQANTTVEAEFSILLPPNIGLLTSRLISKKPLMEDRLEEYIKQIEKNLDSFANAPLRAAVFACTGASYFFEKSQEQDYFNQITKNRGYPVISATTALSDAINALGARRIGIISPYGDNLHHKAMGYWSKKTNSVITVKRLEQSENSFHPIYSLQSIFSKTYLKEFEESKVEVILILGTGIPTLRTLLRLNDKINLISANLCLMWRVSLLINNQEPSFNNLKEWISGKYWKELYAHRTNQ